MAQLLYAAGRAQEAIAMYRDLVKRKPSLVGAHLALGNALADEGQFDAAIVEFRTVLRIQPHNQEAVEHLKTALSLQSAR